MPISGQKNRTIRRKMGPEDFDHKSDDDFFEEEIIEPVKGVDDGKVDVPGLGNDGAPRKRRTGLPKQNSNSPGGDIGDDAPPDEPLDSPDEDKTPVQDDEEDGGHSRKKPGEDLGGDGEDNGTVEPRKIPPIGGNDDNIQTIKKNFQCKYEPCKSEPERSKWWWVKYLCCLLIVILLLWILWCLYSGCQCKNVTVGHSEVVQVSKVSPVKSPALVPGVAKDTNKTSSSENTTGNKMKTGTKPQDANISSGQKRTNSTASNGNNSRSVPPKNDGTNFTSSSGVKQTHEERMKHLKGLYRARVLPDNVEPDLNKIHSSDNNTSVLQVMQTEVTMKDYFYFANGNPQHYPAFWDNGKEDVRKNIVSSYYNSCLEENCPVIGISREDMQAYVSWLNRRVTDGKYAIMTKKQWRSIASYGVLNDEVWYRGNAGGTPHAVASKKPNEKGIYDSYGNVAEIVITKDGYEAVGGSWKSAATELEKSYTVKPNERSNWFGFRLIKIIKKKDEK